VEVQGDLPQLSPLIPQELVVRVTGRQPQVVTLRAAGPFSFTVPLATAAPAPGVWEISRHGSSTDSRELSVRLSLVRALTADGRHVVRTLGIA
jgi:hypothetical protein